MASDPKMRASDADRDRTAAFLREHHAAGRLTPDEFGERLDRTYAAKTLGELDQILSDLPAIDLYELPDASLRRSRHGLHGGLPWSPGAIVERPGGRMTTPWRAAWGSCISVSLVAFVLWLASGHPVSFWFLWVAGPYTLILLGRWLSGSPPRGDGRGSSG